ncbi:MAG TPA: SGNH/GDSL hydrolase family protein [Burkholderiaceae bacterium]|nr:SGNH/GDSL hydrolase family protein [Burkholderiaceae bacterium]
MKAFGRFLAGCIASWVVATSAYAAPYSQFVVFGDSLSDAGNASFITSNLFPPSPPYAGTFSNGPTAAQYLANLLGVSVGFGWSGLSGAANNYAVGGGLNGTGNYNVQIGNPPGLGVAFPTMAVTGIRQQIERYALVNPVVPNAASTLFMVWGGPNNIFLGAETGGDPTVYVPAALIDLRDDLVMLAAMGAQHLFVPSMPDLGLTPEARGKGPAAMAALSALSAAYNGGLAQVLAGLDTAFDPLGIDLYSFDTAAFFADVTANPAMYGFTNVTDSCLYSAAACSTYLYFDNVHPTTLGHDLLALQFASALGIVPEPAMTGLVLVAVVGLLGFLRRPPRSVARAAN